MNYRAVRRQHVLPKKSIERFYSGKNCVQLMLMDNNNKKFSAAADNKLFVADRKWDERVEKEVNGIEERFQRILDTIIEGEILDASAYEIINVFYATYMRGV